MASLSNKFHTSCEVWNKYGTRKGAWTLAVPYLPYLPYLVLHTRMHVHAYVRACTYGMCNYSMERMERMEQSMMMRSSDFHTSSIRYGMYGTYKN